MNLDDLLAEELSELAAQCSRCGRDLADFFDDEIQATDEGPICNDCTRYRP
jgi:hypothetical protein